MQPPASKPPRPQPLVDTGQLMKWPFARTLYRVVQPSLEAILGIDTVNRLHRSNQHILEPAGFAQGVLDDLKLQFTIRDEDVARLQAVQGPLVIVANHPFGGIEAMILMVLMARVRPEFKVMANFLLGRIDSLRPIFISVDPFGGAESRQFNMKGLREALSYLQGGGFLGVFPAGEVAALNPQTRKIQEPEWNSGITRIIQKTGASVVPVFFHGHNSLLFQIASLINPRLRTALLAREVANKRKRKVEFQVGSVISAEKIATYPDTEALTAYLRSKTYILGSRLQESKLKFKPMKNVLLPPPPQHMEEIVPAVPREVLLAEIESLPQDTLLLQMKEMDILLVHGNTLPNLLQEVGRLREITFRGVGEGTGKRLDVDKFDEWYEHIVIWNREKHEVVGAYRMGRVDHILATKGQQGLYTNTLFHIQPQLFRELGSALELGRSFVRPEYQRTFYPLLMLWCGIGRYIAREPRYYSLFGPVSISGEFQTTSKDLMIKFLMDNNISDKLKDLVRPRNPYHLDPARTVEFYNSFSIKSLNDVQDLMTEIETTDLKVPILLKHYLRMGGVILAFNVDPDFSDVVDGLIHIDLRRTPSNMLRKYMGEPGYANFQAVHQLPEIYSLKDED